MHDRVDKRTDSGEMDIDEPRPAVDYGSTGVYADCEPDLTHIARSQAAS